MLFAKFSALALLYINIGRPQDVLPILKSFYPGILFGFLCIVSVVFVKIEKVKHKEKYFENSLVLVIFIWMVISSMFSIHMGKSLDAIISLAKTLTLYVCLFKFFKTEKDFDLIASIFLLCNLTLVFNSLTSGATSYRSSVGTNYDPNDLSLVIACCLPFVFYVFERNKNLLIKAVAGITIFGSIVQLISTQSRMGFLLVVLFVIVYLIRQAPSFRGLVLRLLFMCILIPVFFTMMTPEYRERVNTLLSDDNTGSGRTYIWKRAIVMVNKYPVFGVGVGAFTSAYGRMLSEGVFEDVDDRKFNVAWKTAHNSYLKIMVETGYPGIFLYLLLTFKSLRRMNSVRKFFKENSLYSLYRKECFTETSMIIFLFGTIFINQEFSPIYLTLVLMAVLLERIKNSTYTTHLKAG